MIVLFCMEHLVCSVSAFFDSTDHLLLQQYDVLVDQLLTEQIHLFTYSCQRLFCILIRLLLTNMRSFIRLLLVHIPQEDTFYSVIVGLIVAFTIFLYNLSLYFL